MYRQKLGDPDIYHEVELWYSKVAEQAKLEAEAQAREEAEEQAKANERARAEQHSRVTEQTGTSEQVKAWALKNLRPDKQMDEEDTGSKTAGEQSGKKEPTRTDDQLKSIKQDKLNMNPDVHLKLDMVPAASMVQSQPSN